jgi:CopG family nickel-responsive transcriptional regulator
MSKRENTFEILSFSVPRKLCRDLETLTGEIGYSNRSELIRDALRLFMKSKVEVDELEGMVEGVIITLYEHSAGVLVSDLRHANMDVIRSYMHTDFNAKTKTCCDVLIYSGQADRVKALIFDLKTVKNVREVKLFVA